LAPAALLRGPIGTRQATPLGEGFILQAVKDILFLWVLRSTTISLHPGECFSAHLHTHMGMPPAPGHESWPQGLPPPCQEKFSEDASESCTILGQHRSFLLMEIA